MKITSENSYKVFKDLSKPFPASAVKWFVKKKSNDGKKGMALAYIDSRSVMNRLDRVLGPANWQRKHSFGSNGEVMCKIGIKVDGDWIWKEDGGAQTQFEKEKGGLSDAFKRAAVNWGVARYLYYLDAKWVPIDKYRNIKNAPKLPDWAIPDKDKNNNQEKNKNNNNEVSSQNNVSEMSKEEILAEIRTLIIGNKNLQITTNDYLKKCNTERVSNLSNKQLKQLKLKLKKNVS